MYGSPEFLACHQFVFLGCALSKAWSFGAGSHWRLIGLALEVVR
jgi:hypothetical protein